MHSYLAEFDEATYEEYLKGLIAKKQSGFRDAKEEFQSLKNQFKAFTAHNEDKDKKISWDKTEREISFY